MCGYLLHDGIPPLEALSQDQAAVVGGVEDHPARHDVLASTKFEGMSTYSFCGFCLTVIRDYIDVLESRTHIVEWYHDEETTKPRLVCSCGEVYLAPTHPLACRWSIQHRVTHVYDIRYMDIIHRLPIDTGMEYGMYNSCDWCGMEGVAARGQGDESTGGHVLSICQTCDENAPKEGQTPQWSDLGEEGGEAVF